MMMGTLRCKWVRDRLPLLVGDELLGLDRRRVERHLIGCPQCRLHQASLGAAVGVLRAVAATSATGSSSDAPSLWPALARQIRESRRPVPTPTFAGPMAWLLCWPRANPWPVLGLGLALVATIGVGFEVLQESTAAQEQLVANARPIRPAFAPPWPQIVAVPSPRPRSRPRPRPAPGPEVTAPAETPDVESTSPTHLDYDLEHGLPMPTDTREPRDTKNTY